MLETHRVGAGFIVPMGHQLAIGGGDIVGIKCDRTLGGKLLQEEIHVVAFEGVAREVDVEALHFLAVNARVTLEVIVIGFDGEIVNPVTGHDARNLG